jgi:translation initiation factor IF-3
VNDQITARQIRLVSDRPNETSDETDETDSNDTKSTHEIVSTLVALRRAKLAGLDLVEVNARADPPVCRLMRYDSFRYAQRQKEKDGKRKAMERRRADTVKELKLTARISANDLRVKADKAVRFLTAGHRVTLRVEFKTNDGVKQSLRPKAGAVLFDEFRGVLSDEFEKAHVVAQEGKMVGPNHMTITLAPEKERGEGKRKGKTREEKKSAQSEADTGIQSRAVSSGDKNDKVDPEASSEDEELRRADPASALAEAAAQGDVVRALKARRGAGDDAVEQKDVDDAVARLLRLKARAQSLRGDSRDSRAPKTSVAPFGAASASSPRGFASFSAARRFASLRFSSRPFGSSAYALYSQSAHGRAGERVGAAKARARRISLQKAAKKEARRKENIVSELVAEVNDADASSSSLTALSPTQSSGVRDLSLSRDFNARESEASPVSWSDPSSFRLGSEAEEHIKYEREKARVAAVLETRRLERLRAQERIDARANKSSSGPSFSGSFGSSSDSSSDDGSHQGAWAGAAAAATLAAAVAATLAATAEAEWTLFPRRGGDTNDDSPDETKRADGGGGDAKASFFVKKKKTATHPALDAAVAFAGGAGGRGLGAGVAAGSVVGNL